MYRINMGMDIGTSNIRIYMKDKGVVINQPSMVAYEVKSKKILAVGNKAKRMLGKTPEEYEVTSPISYGTISNYTLAEKMVKACVKNALSKRRIWGRPSVCVSIPGEISEMEKRAVLEVVNRIGAKQIFTLDSTIAAAIGCGVDILDNYGHMIVDIGGGTTDVAIISQGGIAEKKSLKIAGDAFTEALIKYVRRKYSVELGVLSAEDAKKEIGSVYKRNNELTYEVKGKNLLNGLPDRVRLSSEETRDTYLEVANPIIDTIVGIVETAPTELIADVFKEGIILTGGGSLIHGMDKLIQEKTGIKTFVSEKAMEVVAAGTGMAGEFIALSENY